MNKEIDKLEYSIKRLEDIVKEIKKKVENKNEIITDGSVKIFEHLFKFNIENAPLVKISTEKNSKEKKIISKNRAKGPNGVKQDRHVIPYSFVQSMLSSQLKSKDNYKDFLLSLSENSLLYTYNNKGICLTKSEYLTLIMIDKSVEYDHMITLKKNKNNALYIIDGKNKFMNIIKKNINIENRHYELYIEKKHKHIKKTIKECIDHIDEKNDLKSLCECLIECMFTLFNFIDYISFPDEGNTLNYEIRLYENKNSLDYKVITPLYIKKNINKLHNNDNIKIKIVKNEGPIVKRTSKALNCLHDIITGKDAGIIEEELLEKYNNKYNIQLFLDNISINEIKEYNEKLDLKTGKINYHIAKHLYYIFDYKKLEDIVFVKDNFDSKFWLDEENIQYNNIKFKVYEGSKENKDDIKIFDYIIVDGKIYREYIKLKQKTHKKKILYRNENIDKKEKEIISCNIINCVWIILITYPSFLSFNLNKEILEAFSKLICISYDIPYENFYEKYIKLKIDKINIFNINDEDEDNTSMSSLYSYKTKEYINNILNE